MASATLLLPRRNVLSSLPQILVSQPKVAGTSDSDAWNPFNHGVGRLSPYSGVLQGPEWGCPRTSGPVPSDPARCQVRRKRGGAEIRTAREGVEDVGGVGAPRPSAPARAEHVARSLLTFPQGHPPGLTAIGGGGESQAPAGVVRVLPRQGPGSWWLRPRGRRSGRRRLSAFQELAKPALYLLLRGPCGNRESASAAAAPGPGAVPARGPQSDPSRCPPLRTCAALCDQLAWPLSDGVHGAEGPPRALLGRTPSPPHPPARGQVPYPPLRLALGGRRGLGPFNGLRGAAGRRRARYTPPALKGPARLRGARGIGGASALWETDPTRRGEAGAGLAGLSAPPALPKAKAGVLSWGLELPSAALPEARSAMEHPERGRGCGPRPLLDRR